MPSTKKHILVVEDEQHLAILHQIQSGSRRLPGHDGGRWPGGLEAARSGGPEQIDLIILDLMLPGMSGYTVCEALAIQRE